MSVEKAFKELVEVMARLRAPGGCPWDREQTHDSIISYLIEEAHETQEALASKDWEEFRTELGDILCQVVFHALIASEAKRFTLEDIIAGLKKKLVRRHPHVFAETEVSGSDEVLKNWERIKQAEKTEKAKNVGAKRASPILSGIPSTLPALMRAYRLGQKASRVGFEFPSVEDTLDKVEEELAELRTELSSNTRGGEASFAPTEEKLSEEFGDLLFSLVNVARHLKINPEDALLTTTRKFQKRFEYIEQRLTEQGKSIEEVDLAEMDALWEEAKERGS